MWVRGRGGGQVRGAEEEKNSAPGVDLPIGGGAGLAGGPSTAEA